MSYSCNKCDKRFNSRERRDKHYLNYPDHKPNLNGVALVRCRYCKKEWSVLAIGPHERNGHADQYTPREKPVKVLKRMGRPKKVKTVERPFALEADLAKRLSDEVEAILAEPDEPTVMAADRANAPIMTGLEIVVTNLRFEQRRIASAIEVVEEEIKKLQYRQILDMPLLMGRGEDKKRE